MQLFAPRYLTPAVCTKEQNDQIQESDAGASVEVSGHNQQCVTVCSMFRQLSFRNTGGAYKESGKLS